MNYNLLNKKISILEKLYLYFHNQVYQIRLKKQIQFVDKFIISIGNITTGGTGKTPLTILLAKSFLNQHKKVLICLRGYKGSFKNELIVSENGKLLTTPYISGDEAYLISYKLIEKKYKNFKVVCGKDRARLIRNFGADYEIILLDDAFQNPSVYKDKEIVLINCNDDPNNIRLLPMGKYREPIGALQRSHIIIFTHVDENPENFKQWRSITNSFRKKEFISNHEWDQIIPDLSSQKIIGVCGIGNPDSFFHLLEEKGYQIEKQFIYRDHHDFTNSEVQKWLQYHLPIVLTEKDWVRLLYNSVFLQNKNNFYRLVIDLKIKNFPKFFKELRT